MTTPLRVGVIACSGMAKTHMKAVQANDRAILAAVCDIDEAKARETAEAFGVRYSTDYRDLLTDDIDAVIIVTPDQLHREMVEAALAAGKHVLCEKPLALTREDLAAIVAAGRASDRVLMVGQICRYTPGFAQAKAIIDAGEIGELYFVESEYAHDYAKIPGVGGWRTDPRRHGMIGGGCHAVDLLRWVAGDPTEVTAYGSHFCLPEIPYDDCTIAILRFPTGCVGKVFCSTGCKRGYTMRSCFYGTKGTIITDNTSPEMTAFRTNADGKAVAEQVPIVVNNHNAVGEFAEFCDLILDGGEVKTTAREGAKAVAACLAIVESAKSGRPVAVDYTF